MNKKIAFIDYGGPVGSYIDHYLRNQVFENTVADLAGQQYKAFNSRMDPFNMARDWNEDELLQLAKNQHPAQFPTPAQVCAHHQRWASDYLSRQYVHNHCQSWSLASAQAFRHSGWLTFMFLQDPMDLLCSLWASAQKQNAVREHLQQEINPAWLIYLSPDLFLQEIVETEEFWPLFALPEYIDEVDYVIEFTEENFRQFLLEQFGHDSISEESARICIPLSDANTSYNSYRNQGLISEETNRIITTNPEVRRVRERLKST